MLSALRQACNAIIRSSGVPSYRLATWTPCPSSRRIRTQRAVVVPLPDRDDERTGVIITTFMNETLKHRPTSGATAGELAGQLSNIRACTRRLTEDLSVEQLMGPMLPI